MLSAILMWSSAVCAVVPATLFCMNLRRYRAPAPVPAGKTYAVSVLIPARNEEANIGAAVRGVLASRGVSVDVLVLDDDSSDRTAGIVREIAAEDARVRLVCGRGLPAGWNGKQHACWVLANEATRPSLVFLDADVRIEPDLLARMAGFQERTGAALVSGFPRLITVTWMEQLLLPLIHFVLLGFLPMGAMRRSTSTAFAAGCGQFMLVQREAYFLSGGHAAIRESMHDGLLLPRVLRRAGYPTDLADITRLASVRMYDSAAKVWQGLAKNATEGIATAGKIVPLSLFLSMGQVMTVALALSWGAMLLIADAGGKMRVRRSDVDELTVILAAGVIATYIPRLLAVRRFRQPLSSALLHPAGVVLLLAVQWYAFTRKLFGRPVGWRQRSYSSETGTQVG